MKSLAGRLGAAVAVAVVLFTAYLLYLQLSGNFHVVSEGVVYRAAQMDGSALADWKREYGIASVLNLRVGKDGATWYDEERTAAESLGIQHIDFPMSDHTKLSETGVRAPVDVMRQAPKPLLIHCKAGSDRTGLASLLYLVAVEGREEEEAERQLSVTFGHIGIPLLSRASAMDDTWESVERLFGIENS